MSSDTAEDGSGERERPKWALDWMPTWLITMRPIYQLVVALLIYLFHLAVLTQHSIPLPFQLIPNNLGHFQMIPLDSLAGFLSVCGYQYIRNAYKRNGSASALPSMWRAPTKEEAPWKLPKLKSLARLPGPKSTGTFALFLLVQAYFWTGRFSLFWEDALYAMAGVGFPMTIAMHRSLVVLLGHLTWVAVGGLILGLIPRPQPVFGGGFQTDDNGAKKRRKYRWFSSQWNTYWLWWTLGGYFVTSWAFNFADFVNQMVLPHQLLISPAEGVVSQLVNPEHNDWLASFVGALAPCWSAPWWEELLYRGFMLPALTLHLPYGLAVWFSGVVFSVHHISATGAIPLMVLGWIWAYIYTKSGNLLVTIMIHAMWNSRVFLGNWFGL